jgi:hypothetical protein
MASSDKEEEYIQPSIEIVGLLRDNNGRSCTQHACCGHHLKGGDLVVIVPVMLQVRGKMEPAVKVVKIVEGKPTCTVGFLPRLAVRTKKVKAHFNTYVQILELYENSPNSYKRRLWNENYGMASGVYTDEILPVHE